MRLGSDLSTSCSRRAAGILVFGPLLRSARSGAPDAGDYLNPVWHCDNADVLAGGYPRTRPRATVALVKCRTHLQRSMNEAVVASARMVDANDWIFARTVDPGRPWTFVLGIGGHAKCDALEAFGRVLHDAQDFYSHSNHSIFPPQAADRRAIAERNCAIGQLDRRA
jgi:hypothetical protein